MKMRDCTIYVPKTKALINFAVIAKLLCTFVFTYMYADCWFSDAVTHLGEVRIQGLDLEILRVIGLVRAARLIKGKWANGVHSHY